MTNSKLTETLIKRTNIVPVNDNQTAGNGQAITRQLDSALMNSGFKLSQGLLEKLSKMHPAVVTDLATSILNAVSEMIGDNVEHNVYFKEFPMNVPDTLEFWKKCIVDALFDPKSASTVAIHLASGVVNLLDLPTYGRYQHTYEEMVAAHEQFIASGKERVTILHLGDSLAKEAHNLYLSLAGSVIPLNESDLELLKELAEVCLEDDQPEKFPIRENKAVINQVRLANDRDILVDTTTDVLRLACALSDGDVSLQEKTKFKSFPRAIRKFFLNALDQVISQNPGKLADINQYREPWKRLAERLHPYENTKLTNAHEVFAVARKDKRVYSLVGKAELAFANKNIASAIELYAKQPGMLFRNMDRIITAASSDEVKILMNTVNTVIPKVSGRVILSLREHLVNRVSTQQTQARIFANKRGTAYVTPEARQPLDNDLVDSLITIFDDQVISRLPAYDNLVVNQDILDVALPLSDKNKAQGFGILPRGTVTPVDTEILGFFIHWEEKNHRTDYDLSVIFLDDKFTMTQQASWTNLRGEDFVHSGDLVESAGGATEIIDIMLKDVDCTYIVPQVNIFRGESFPDVKESFFGYMERTSEQMGSLPYEPQTVRIKSEVRGKGKVALPLIFMRDNEGKWSAKWMHLYLNGYPNCNRVELNKLSTSLLVKSIVARNYLRVGYFVDLMKHKALKFSWFDQESEITDPVTYLGLATPEGLPEGSTSINLTNLNDLIIG